MKCDGCKKNEANVVLHMITNGQLATRSLCMSCARKAHGEMSQAFTTMGMNMAGLEDLQGAAAQEAEQLRLPRMICSTCRTPYEAINHETVFGCPQCYAAFHEQIIAYLSGLRGPEMPDEQLGEGQQERHPVIHVTTEDLRQRLKEAIHDEDYEQAANLRDRLKEIGATEGTSDA